MKPFEWAPPGTSQMDEKRPLRRQPDDHHFASLIMAGFHGCAQAVPHARLRAALLR
jgi:hypothetical protein